MDTPSETPSRRPVRPWLPYLILACSLALTLAAAYYVIQTGAEPAGGRRYVDRNGVVLLCLLGLAASVTLFAVTRAQVRALAAAERTEAELRESEAALRESEQRFRAIFEQAAVGAACVGPDGQFLRLNQKFCDILGYTPAELLKKSYQEITHRDDLTVNVEEVRKLLSGEINSYSIEKRYLRKDGAPLWVHLTASAVRDAAQKVKYTLAIVEDISAHKRLEEQLRQSQKMDAIGRLAGGVAHDFNNLLTVILGRGELLLSKLPTTDPARHDVELIQTTAERAATLTRQLLQFSRQQVLQPTIVELNATIIEMETMLRRLIGEDIHLVTKLEAGLAAIKADPGQVQQIIMNLAVNSRDAMPQGGTLYLETSNVTLDATFVQQHLGSKAGHYVMLAVSDTGCGMDEKVRAHVFEPFFTTKGQGKGTGLGLSTVYGIVKQNGGYIYVYSEPGHGATFRIYLPRIEGSKPTSSPKSKIVPGKTTVETILLAEDEDGVRQLSRDVLTGAGYRVLVARDGAEALRLSAQHGETIHLLLTDVVMPNMSGPELAKCLSAQRPSMRVLFMSGYTSDVALHREAFKSDVAFLEKPFTPDTLVRKVRKVLAIEPLG